MKKKNFVIKFEKPYKFEDQTFKEIDLSGLNNLKSIDLIECQNEFAKRGKIDALIEMNLDYCMLIASRVCNKPIEFFLQLPAKYATMIKHKISGFLLGAV